MSLKDYLRSLPDYSQATEIVVATDDPRNDDLKGAPYGQRNGKYKHGCKGTPEWKAWRNAKYRCTNPNSPDWKNYGGRGIRMAKRFRDSFEDFLAHVGKRPSPEHTLERIDNDRGYVPGNVRWATRVEQARNKRPRRR